MSLKTVMDSEVYKVFTVDYISLAYNTNTTKTYYQYNYFTRLYDCIIVILNWYSVNEHKMNEYYTTNINSHDHDCELTKWQEFKEMFINGNCLDKYKHCYQYLDYVGNETQLGTTRAITDNIYQSYKGQKPLMTTTVDCSEIKHWFKSV